MKPPSVNNPDSYANLVFNSASIGLGHANHGSLGVIFITDPKSISDIHDCTIEVDEASGNATLRPNTSYKERKDLQRDKVREMYFSSSFKGRSAGQNMTNQDRQIDAHLAGIEGKLDAKIEGIRESVMRMQKGFDDAENRFEKAASRHDTEIALYRQQTQQEFKDSRRHAVVVSITTIFGVAAVIGIVAAFAIGWIGEQGSYARSFGETQVELQRAADERAEFREAVQTIQQTQQDILERLPAN